METDDQTFWRRLQRRTPYLLGTFLVVYLLGCGPLGFYTTLHHDPYSVNLLAKRPLLIRLYDPVWWLMAQPIGRPLNAYYEGWARRAWDWRDDRPLGSPSSGPFYKKNKFRLWD